MAMPLGTLTSFLLPNLFLDDKSNKDDFHLYVLVQTIIITGLSLPALIFLKEQPPSPPTVLLKEGGTMIPMGMLESIKNLFKNRNYICLFLSFNFLYGL